jgi:hypothetical protein
VFAESPDHQGDRNANSIWGGEGLERLVKTGE